MGVNSALWLIKVVLLQLTPHYRSFALTGWISISLQVLQGVAVTTLYILSYTRFEKDFDDRDIQDWFWSEGKPWLSQMTGYMLGIFEYYYMFILAAFAIIVIIMSTIACLGFTFGRFYETG